MGWRLSSLELVRDWCATVKLSLLVAIAHVTHSSLLVRSRSIGRSIGRS